MNCSKEGGGIFCISGSHTSPLLQNLKCIFNKMSQFIQVVVIITLFFPIFAWRDDRCRSICFHLFHESITVITFIPKQVFSVNPLYETASLRTISDGT